MRSMEGHIVLPTATPLFAVQLDLMRRLRTSCSRYVLYSYRPVVSAASNSRL